jgi:hypothetical protein
VADNRRVERELIALIVVIGGNHPHGTIVARRTADYQPRQPAVVELCPRRGEASAAAEPPLRRRGSGVERELIALIVVIGGNHPHGTIVARRTADHRLVVDSAYQPRQPAVVELCPRRGEASAAAEPPLRRRGSGDPLIVVIGGNHPHGTIVARRTADHRLVVDSAGQHKIRSVMMSLKEKTQTLFAEAFGYPASHVIQAPGRGRNRRQSPARYDRRAAHS